MRRLEGRRLSMIALALALLAAGALVVLPSLQAQDSTRTTGKPKKSKDKKEKSAEDADGQRTTEKKKKDDDQKAPKDSVALQQEARAKVVKDSLAAERRALFASAEPLPFTLIANFNAINKDRDSTSQKRYSGTLVVQDAAGAERRIAVQLRTRGHFRLKRSTCKFVNLLVIFPGKAKDADGTPFDGQKSLKLGGHCQDDARYEQQLRREYLAYRIYNVITPRSFRARLATGTYLDSASNRSLGTRTAMWIENEDDMARRQGGRVREFRRALFEDMEPVTLDRMAIFEYLIGNTDWSIYSLHNERLVVTENVGALPVAYDFDFSGLVDAPYATPAPQLPIRSVRDRLYRGPCRKWEELAPTVEHFRSRQAEIMALPATIPGLDARDVKDVREFLQPFFETVSDPRRAKEVFVDGCLRKPGA